MGKQGSFIKRLTDIIFSLFVLSLASPIIIIAALLIKLESKGSVFFLHERTGSKGKKFRLYKLRGMVNNALDVGPELTQLNDPRITKVGKILRRTSIDEIPNFINVLKGEMSIVGPRPDISSITDTYTSDQRKVFNFKPGVTGISQINGRQMLTPKQRVQMEIDYYNRATFWSDLLIVFKTFNIVINNKGNV
ncbi:MAG: sugar transferase [Ignavibacteria bacterium]|nr:sugar transferase [Ignavibacteria bacterium]